MPLGAEVAQSTMPTDFATGRWIAMPAQQRRRAAPLLRRPFQVPVDFQNAELLICGLGYYEAYINGSRVGDHVLDPAQTDYDRRCLYVRYDITDLLRCGDNVLGVIMGDGFFNQDIVWRHHDTTLRYGEPRLLARLRVGYQEGPDLVVDTDSHWRCHTGPILSSNVYAGETYDARLEQAGWSQPGFDASRWAAVQIVDPPGGKLERQTVAPNRRIEQIRPVAIHRLTPTVHLVDMGQNFAGWARIQIAAPTGTRIALRYAEAVDAKGRLDTASTGVFATMVEQIDTFICDSRDAVQTWEPRFTYHGFRYVEVTGWPGELGADDIAGIAVHTDLKPAGHFECSDPRLNQLHQMARWTLRSNLHGIPTDCPAREKCGWLGDAHIMCEYTIYNYHAHDFWKKYLADIETSRLNNQGLPTNVSPGRRFCGTANPDWMAALILIPWYLYVYYGDRDVLARHWPGMQTVIAHLRQISRDWIIEGGYGDWCDPENSTKPTYTPPALTSTAWFHVCTRVMAEVATQLGQGVAADEYRSWLEPIASAFASRWFDKQADTFGSQTADAMALMFGLSPAGRQEHIARSLVKDIRQRRAMHHTVGIMGLRALFEALSRFGQGETALALLHQDSYPSFGDLITHRDATTLWEYWGETEVDQADGPRSLNHPMMGGFDNWFFNTLAGIRPDPASPGFAHFHLSPCPPPGLAWVSAHYDCPHGRIASQWRIENDQFIWTVDVPQGTRATATLPFSKKFVVLDPGRAIGLRDVAPSLKTS